MRRLRAGLACSAIGGDGSFAWQLIARTELDKCVAHACGAYTGKLVRLPSLRAAEGELQERSCREKLQKEALGALSGRATERDKAREVVGGVVVVVVPVARLVHLRQPACMPATLVPSLRTALGRLLLSQGSIRDPRQPPHGSTKSF